LKGEKKENRNKKE